MTAPTPEELAALTLPGTYPGLLRECSPVVDRGQPGVYYSPYRPEGSKGRHFIFLTHMHRAGSVPLYALSLRLTSATGRAHANWWLRGGKTGGPDCSVYLGVGEVVYFDGYAECRSPEWGGSLLGIVPALGGLDPNDPRLLPDGSRYIDALALKLVCEHVEAQRGGS